MIRAVFFDLDHTLYDRQSSLVRLAPVFFRHFRALFPAEGIDEAVLAERLIAADGKNYVGWPAVYDELTATLPWSPPGYSAYEDFMNHNLGLCAVPWPETSAVLQWCVDHKLTTGMITNGREDLQNDKIDALGVRRYFRHFIISGVFGRQKPDAAIFQHAVELTRVPAQEIVYVGDNPVNDILASASVGMTPIWLDHFSAWPEGAPRPKHIAHSLGEVPEILHSMVENS